MAFYTIYTFFTYINIILYFHILFQYLMMAIEKNFCIWMAQYLLHIKVPAYVYFKLLLTFYIQIYKSILSAYIKCHIKSKSVSHQQYEKELVLTFHAVISPLLIWILIIWIRFFFTFENTFEYDYWLCELSQRCFAIGSIYNIPICVWIMDTHPYKPPMVFVKPTSTMQIKTGRHVDSNGKVDLPTSMTGVL